MRAFGRPIGVDRRQGHRLRQGHDGLGLLEPLRELLERIIRKLLAVERRVIGATWAHLPLDSRENTGFQTNGTERMPGVPVGAPL